MDIIGPVRWLLLGATFAGAAEPVHIQLRGKIELAAPQALVRDLADLSGPAEDVIRLATLPVQDLFGANTFSITPAQVRRVCATQAPGIAIQVAGVSQVVQARRSISLEVQLQAAIEAVTLPGDEAQVTLVRANGVLVVGDDGRSPELKADVLEPAAVGEIPVRIRVMHGEREEARSLVIVHVRRYRKVAVLAADVARGQLISAADVIVERMEIVRALNDPLDKGEDAVGLVAQRDMAAGTVLRKSQLSLPLAVRPGQAIQLLWRNGAIELGVNAESLAAGRVGDQVSVRRQSDGQVVRGQVEAPGIVALVR